MTRSRGNSPTAFGFLAQLGLKTINITGDGNCLFYALSDQIFGTPSKAKELRSTVINHMREHPELYIDFVIVDETRRNPKRKNTKSATNFTFVQSTLDEQQTAFEAHLQMMAKGGTWGDNIELQAFANAFNCKVTVYREDSPTTVSRPQADNVSTDQKSAYIAYHNWQHYSSVRNINGPLTGLPCVQPQEISKEDLAKAEDGRKGVTVKNWMVKSVMTSLPHLMDRALVIRVLEKNRGSVDAAVAEFLKIDSNSSTPSSPGSSSVSRDTDSEDEDPIQTSNIRRIRRTKEAKSAAKILAKVEKIKLPESDSEDEDPIRGANLRQNRKIEEAKKIALAELEKAKLAVIPTIKSTSAKSSPEFTTSTTEQPNGSVLASNSDTTSNVLTSKLPPSSTLPPPTYLPKLSVDAQLKSHMKKSSPTPVGGDSPPTKFMDTLYI